MSKSVEEAVKDVPVGRYVVAVSGGIDSVSLLHALKQRKDLDLVVAHFDHGIRPDSQKDSWFVEQLASELKLPFISQKGKLGAKASEAEARSARYDFLQRVKEQQKADAIITAHHADDVIETMIINLLRGTNRRGLSSLRDRPGLRRPLLSVRRESIQQYAKTNSIGWREDPTNLDTAYLRNYVRRVLVPKIKQLNQAALQKFFDIAQTMAGVNDEIDSELERIVAAHCELSSSRGIMNRYWYTMLPSNVRQEVLAHILNHVDSKLGVSSDLLKRVNHFLLTARLHKTMPVSGSVEAVIEPQRLLIQRST